MVVKVFLVVCFWVAAGADKLQTLSYAAPQQSSEESYESSEAKYDFSYAVKDESSGNDFGHQESRDNDNTKGSYYVQLPDGRLQTVTYYVDGDSGYVVEVTYQGEARYPESSESSESSEAGGYDPRRSIYG